MLVVTERTAQLDQDVGTDDEGIINTFLVHSDGLLGTQRLIDATGQGPFGFTFNKQGALLTTEQFDGLLGPGEGAAAGYTVNADGTLTATSGPCADSDRHTLRAEPNARSARTCRALIRSRGLAGCQFGRTSDHRRTARELAYPYCSRRHA